MPAVESEWRRLVLSSSGLKQFGFRLVWGTSRGYRMVGLDKLLGYAKPIATHVASKFPRCLFPLPVDFSIPCGWSWTLGDPDFGAAVESWAMLVAAALNDLYGSRSPYPTKRSGLAVKRCLEVIRDRVKRFLSQFLDEQVSHDEVWKDVSKKHISYDGEEVALAQPLCVSQVLKSLPPLGHGGSVDLIPLLEGRTKFLMEHPEQAPPKRGSQKGGKEFSKGPYCTWRVRCFVSFDVRKGYH